MTISILSNEYDSTELPEYLLQSVLTEWSCPAWVRSYLSRYYILHWQTEYFSAHSAKSTLHHDGIEYIILYHKCTLEHLKTHDEVALSFRKLKVYPYGYVLVKPL